MEYKFLKSQYYIYRDKKWLFKRYKVSYIFVLKYKDLINWEGYEYSK